MDSKKSRWISGCAVAAAAYAAYLVVELRGSVVQLDLGARAMPSAATPQAATPQAATLPAPRTAAAGIRAPLALADDADRSAPPASPLPSSDGAYEQDPAADEEPPEDLTTDEESTYQTTPGEEDASNASTDEPPDGTPPADEAPPDAPSADAAPAETSEDVGASLVRQRALVDVAARPEFAELLDDPDPHVRRALLDFFESR